MNPDRVLSLLGLASRAQKLVLGENFVLEQLKHYPESIIFMASDSGQNITKKVQDKAKTYNITVVRDYSSEELSHALGKEHRKLVLVTDKGFCMKFMEYLNS